VGKKTIAKVVQISDIIQWHEKGELELSPKYQRNSVWNEKAKSYLIDTVVRGLPIPPIFLRQKTDILTKKTFREVIDGQQRLRSLIEYIVQERFAIKSTHNKEFANMKYSDLDDEIKEQILEYEIVAEVVTEKDDSIIYDMFARLNSNNMVLNKQEVRNSKYWGDFKVFIYLLSSEYRAFFSRYAILKDTDFSRMRDTELINSLIILLLKGVVNEPPTYVDGIYSEYDIEFPDSDNIEGQFVNVVSVLDSIFDYLNGQLDPFSNKNYFYTLYAVVAHQMYGLSDMAIQRHDKFSAENINDNINELIERIVSFMNEYDGYVKKTSTSQIERQEDYSDFQKLHKSRTTSKNERTSRITLLNSFLGFSTDEI